MVEVNEVLAAVSSIKRISALGLIGKGSRPADIARTLGISGAGLSRYLESFTAAKLAERNETGYCLLPLGQKVLVLVKEFEKNVSSLVLESTIAEKKSAYKDLIEGIKQTRMLSGRSWKELEKAIEKVAREN